MIERSPDLKRVQHEAINVGGYEGYRLTGDGATFRIGEEIEKGRKIGAPTFQVVYRRYVGEASETLDKFLPDGTKIEIHHHFGSSVHFEFYKTHIDFKGDEVIVMRNYSDAYKNGVIPEIVVVPSFGGERKEYLSGSKIAEDFARLEKEYKAGISE